MSDIKHGGGARRYVPIAIGLVLALVVLSFGLIALSQMPALSAIGRGVAPGVFLALVLSAAFAPRRAARSTPAEVRA